MPEIDVVRALSRPMFVVYGAGRVNDTRRTRQSAGKRFSRDFRTVGTKSGVIDRARRRIAEDDRRVRADIAAARRNSGLSQDAVGAACGISGSAEGRIETGVSRIVDIGTLAAIAAAVGLDLRLRAYPAGDPIRDAGQARLLARLQARVHRSLGWSTEVPLPVPGDLRAWDAVIRGSPWRFGVDAETVIDDIQALERRLALKRRDADVDHLILLVADTARNRRALASAPASFADLPLRTRAILAALRDGRDPGDSGIVVL
jgi:transcriptional regulator with XRE-family HTH domain